MCALKTHLDVIINLSWIPSLLFLIVSLLFKIHSFFFSPKLILSVTCVCVTVCCVVLEPWFDDDNWLFSFLLVCKACWDTHFFKFYSDLVLTVSRQSLRSQRGNKIVFGTMEAAVPGIWTTATRMEMVLQMVPNRTWKHNLIRYLVVFNLTT